MPAAFEKIIFSNDIKKVKMKSEFELIAQIDAYLRGELSPEEHAQFEILRKENQAIDHKVVEHQNFVNQLEEFNDRKKLVARMNAIHDTIDVNGLVADELPSSVKVKRLWNKYRINSAIAASVALITVFATLLSTGYFSKLDSSDYVEYLGRKIEKLQISQNAIISDLSNSKRPKGPVSSAQYGGTGFALTQNGYLITNSHVIKGADSIYVQNAAGDSYKVKVIYEDSKYDIAILHITDPGFTSLGNLPYTFKKKVSDLGEDVYTLGFPRDEQVLNKGYVSSLTGYKGDTVTYQVDIPVNFGNSGGPLLDNKGNIVGIINAKQKRADGASFAVKSKYLIQALDSIPKASLEEDLVLNTKNSLKGLSRTDQIKKLEDYVFMVKVY